MGKKTFEVFEQPSYTEVLCSTITKILRLTVGVLLGKQATVKC
jgi:hypothetical protein